MSSTNDMGSATLQAPNDGLVVVRFKPGSVATPVNFKLSVQVRQRHFGHTRHAVVLIAPEDVDLDPALLSRDHCKDHSAETFTRALAIRSLDPYLPGSLNSITHCIRILSRCNSSPMNSRPRNGQ